jgi:hypothetical protein
MRLGMTAKETNRWTRKRSQGRLRFVFVEGVLLFGGLFLALWVATMWFSASEEYFERVFFSQPVRLISVVALAGAMWGFLMWEFFEYRFRRTPNDSAKDHG